ncbi:metallophosphoesterase [Candidatus Pacearchaeota archaeon]|nr:metallophosphoesterase [Candidatus Pacearchaeota archaeon]
MKILAIGDPHGELGKIKKIPLNGTDLILLTGDIGKADLARKIYFDNIKRQQQGLADLKSGFKQQKEIYNEIHNSTISILKYLSKFAPVYTIEGNVLISKIKDVKKINKKYNINLKSTREEIEKMKNVGLVKNIVRNIYGLKAGFLEEFTDVSWIKEFKPDHYIKRLKKAKQECNIVKRILKKFKDIDILVCHQPPYKVLDKVSSKYNPPKNWIGKHAGSKIILNYIKKYQPKYVFCGHIHEGKGMKRVGKTEVYNLGVAGYKIIEIN